MDHRHLTTLSAQLAAFLAEVLPRLSDHWWQTHVLQELTFQQRNHVDTAGYTRLDQLDLAALLRIADRNWSGSFRLTGPGCSSPMRSVSARPLRPG
ncbi:hypothetical protein [Lamprocystis purpurea]|jgi:hypothetical protein|uniref:hypothetical protein n=1 Tax=Lamprocystis purpurea TaxID=61598 RepID=UPI0003A6390A|nr:hypothetical protein [Lamprocystis purpurea]